MKQFYLFLALLSIAMLSACGSDETGIAYDSPNGVFVVNEGNFLKGNGALSYMVDKKMHDNIFFAANRRDLGDVLQSYSIIDGKGYAVVNNDSKVEVVDAKTMASVATVREGLSLPRYMVHAGTGKAYISNWGSFDGRIRAYIAVLDLATNTVTDSIAIGAGMGTEQMVAANGKVYAGNNFGNTVSIVNASTDELEGSIDVADAPSAMAVANGHLWVLCAGGYGSDFNIPDDDTPAMLYKISLSTHKAVDSLALGRIGNHPSKMALSADGTWGLVVNGNRVMKLELSSGISVAATQFAFGKFYYGVGIRPSDGKVFLCNAEGFSGLGTVDVYSKEGALQYSTSSGGIGPNGVAFPPF